MTKSGLHIGLIGGLAPAATAVYYQKLSKIAAERGHVLEMTLVQANARQTQANNLDGRTNEQAKIFAELLHRLHAAGADFASITAIGPHFCFPETKDLSPLPLLSAITPLDNYCAAQSYKKIGLLGTARAMKTRLFGQIARTETLIPSNFEEAGKAYQDMAISGICTEAYRRLLFTAGREMMDAGAEAILLSGTDLMLAFDGRDPGFPVIDALDIHVAVLADLAAGRISMAEAGVQ